MARSTDYPSREELERQWPADVFDAARALLFQVIWLDLPTEERRDATASRAFAAEEQLGELTVVWRRLRQDRIEQVEWNRRRDELEETLGLGSYTAGTGEHPEIDALYREEYEREWAVSLDFKSLYVFGDLTLSAYVAMSEPVWDAPASVRHGAGLSPFVNDVSRLMDVGVLRSGTEFAFYMDLLHERLRAIDASFGWYRNKFIVHLPPDVLPSPGGGGATPLQFEVSHARQGDVKDAQLRALRRTVRQVERAEGLSLGDDSHDPRPKLRKLAHLLHELKDPKSVATVQNLLLEWGGHSPPLLPTALGLASLLEDWATAFVRRVGLVSG